MKKAKKILMLFINLAVTPVFAGNEMHWSPIDKTIMSADLAAMNQHFQRMRVYQVIMTDASFENYTTSTYHQKATGYYKRDEDKFHAFMMGVRSIQDGECRITIDSAKKIIIVADPTKSMDNNYTLSDFQALLAICTKLLKAKVGNRTYYHLEFQKDYELSSYDLTLKDSLPEKAVMYYSKKIKQGGKEEQPRVEINYDKWIMDVSDKATAFSTEKYVEMRGGNYFLTPFYSKAFKLLDQRVLTKPNKKKKP
ncbi:MAG: hypothetical protein ACLQQ4_17330 [Bacteroidia bacterium]